MPIGRRVLSLSFIGSLVASGALGACGAFSAAPTEPETRADAGEATPVEAATAEAGAQAGSCIGLAATCGRDAGQSCCASATVLGGDFNRSNDASAPATVSDFRLDVYEVTVGRFRAFLNAGQGTAQQHPEAGDGAHPKIPSSGWDESYNAGLASSRSAIETGLKCAVGTWTNAPSANETLPINCVTWFEAAAFCAWDGGRLPTEAEWNYAAAGGRMQREYPWGAGIDDSRALTCGDAGTCFDFRPVGAKSPPGDGMWSHADLAGNVDEWLLDRYVVPYSASCVDCAQLATGADRVIRGGSRASAPPTLRTSSRSRGNPALRYGATGIRCARPAQ